MSHLLKQNPKIVLVLPYHKHQFIVIIKARGQVVVKGEISCFSRLTDWLPFEYQFCGPDCWCVILK